MRAHLPAFVQHLTARAAAPRTIESYERTVRQFLDQLERRPLMSGEVEAFLARPRWDGKPRGASTKRAELMALRGFFHFLARDGAVVDPTHGIIVKRERRQAPRVAMPSDVPLLFEAASRSSAPARNVAILGLLHVLGLRVHELAALDTEQADLAAKVLRRVRGKGGTIVDFPLPDALAAILSAWLRERAMLGNTTGAGPLFPTARPATSRTGRLSIRSVQRLVAKIAEDAGLGRRLGPHALRHGTATAAIWLGIDVPTTAEAMRHASIATTQDYVHLAKDARRETYARIASLIPASVVPTSRETVTKSRNHDENRTVGGGGAPLDFHPLMDDVLGRSERDAPDSDMSSPPTTKHAPEGACLRSEKPEPSRPDVTGGNREDLASIQALLADHLHRVRAAVDESLARLVLDLHELGVGAPAELRPGHSARLALEPDHPGER